MQWEKQYTMKPERARARERDVCISEYLCIFDIRDRQTDQSQTEVKRRRER